MHITTSGMRNCMVMCLVISLIKSMENGMDICIGMAVFPMNKKVPCGKDRIIYHVASCYANRYLRLQKRGIKQGGCYRSIRNENGCVFSIGSLVTVCKVKEEEIESLKNIILE